MYKSLYLFICLLFGYFAQAQQTVGVFVQEPEAFDGYTLISPNSSQRSLLIDNCGRLVHSWESEFNPGLSSYILENGQLLRTGRAPGGQFGAGGQGGLVELFDWDGQLLWRYLYASEDVMQHHDVTYLPNGNVVILAWERKTVAETVAVGRDSTAINNDEFWFEHLVEVRPIFPDSGEIVWRWSIEDHLIQDIDSTISNYGIPSEHPEKMDINFFPEGFSQGFSGPDWVHSNSVDYNADLDQLLLCSRHLGEIWIIDHSTTTAEAASDSGGRYGRGGDLLYRWGNPETYGRGGESDQQLFGPHDANWIPEGYPGAGQIMVFNNGIGQEGRDFSSVITLAPPILPAGDYRFPNSTEAFGPALPDWKYDGNPTNNFFARNLSGAQRLPNGNTLVCDGPQGRYFEVDTLDNVVWSYINPLSRNDPVSQGSTPGVNSTFRVYRYGIDYPGFSGRDLTPGDPVELDPLPLPAECIQTSTSSTISTTPLPTVTPNPFSQDFLIDLKQVGKHQVRVLDGLGRLIFREKTYESTLRITSKDWPNGFYLLQVDQHRPQKLIKAE